MLTLCGQAFSKRWKLFLQTHTLFSGSSFSINPAALHSRPCLIQKEVKSRKVLRHTELKCLFAEGWVTNGIGWLSLYVMETLSKIAETFSLAQKCDFSVQPVLWMVLIQLEYTFYSNVGPCLPIKYEKICKLFWLLCFSSNLLN